jgi:hypothetical protein
LGVSWVTFSPRLWIRVPATIVVNARQSRDSAVYRSAEGTLLVDMRHAPTDADMEGGGYIVQPYWNRVRLLNHEYYKIVGPFAFVGSMWMPTVELRPDEGLVNIDPKLRAIPGALKFTGLQGDHITVKGDLLIEEVKVY